MKFMRCVIEVRPFRLLVDCMAACGWPLSVMPELNVRSGARRFTHGFSNSILIRKPWPSLALMLFSKGLVVPGGERCGARGRTSTKATGSATSTL